MSGWRQAIHDWLGNDGDVDGEENVKRLTPYDSERKAFGMKPDRTKLNVNVRLSNAEHSALKRIADESECSTSDAVRKLIAVHIASAPASADTHWPLRLPNGEIRVFESEAIRGAYMAGVAACAADVDPPVADVLPFRQR